MYSNLICVLIPAMRSTPQSQCYFWHIIVIYPLQWNPSEMDTFVHKVLPCLGVLFTHQL